MLGSSFPGSFRRAPLAEEKLGSRWIEVCTRDRYRRFSSKIESADTTTAERLSRLRGGGGEGGEGQARSGRGDSTNVLAGFTTGTGSGRGSVFFFSAGGFSADGELSLGSHVFMWARNGSLVSRAYLISSAITGRLRIRSAPASYAASANSGSAIAMVNAAWLAFSSREVFSRNAASSPSCQSATTMSKAWLVIFSTAPKISGQHSTANSSSVSAWLSAWRPARRRRTIERAAAWCETTVAYSRRQVTKRPNAAIRGPSNHDLNYLSTRTSADGNFSDGERFQQKASGSEIPCQLTFSGIAKLELLADLPRVSRLTIPAGRTCDQTT